MFGRYQLLDQLGVGADGVRYRALDRKTRGEVELVALSTLADEPGRRLARSRRLARAALLEHPTARRLIELGLEYEPPFVVLETVAKETGRRPNVLDWARTVAPGLAEGHRLGLTHGRLGPDAIGRDSLGTPKLDWTGLGEAPRNSTFTAPELHAGGDPDPAADVFAFGALLLHRLGDDPAALDSDLGGLIRDALARDPADRPPMPEIVRRLDLLAEPSRSADTIGHGIEDANGPAAPSVRGPHTRRDRLGRFLLREKIGEGGMGTVYRAEDLADGSTVAVKVLRDSWAARPEALRRFCKEARLLAEANNPYVTNLIELNSEDGVHFLALEYVRGTTLAHRLERLGRFDEPTALAIVADVARGLAIAHERGIVHRDIKPENILLLDSDADLALTEAFDDRRPAVACAETVEVMPALAPRVKLSDFGLARHIDESESLNMTGAGAILGTPLYMAPEQCAGSRAIGPPADVYALGATLFHLLAGRPPFEAPSALDLIAKHRHEPAPELKAWSEEASGGVCQVVARALAKAPEHRYADAGAMLADLERLLRGEPTGIEVHPKLPATAPRDLVRFDFQWDLDAEPAALWPHVSNTERLNRAIGLPAVPFTASFEPGKGVERTGHLTTAGLKMSWREHPFEWIEGRRFGVLREFEQGPFRWFVSLVELAPRAGGGTTLTHSIRVSAKGLFGRTVANVKLGQPARRALDRIYRRIDATLTGKLGADPITDPFEAPAALSKPQQRRLDRWVAELGRQGIDAEVAERVGDYLAQAPAPEVARIRPLALANRLGLDPDQVVEACLRGAREGLLILSWDLLCPVCRIPSEVVGTLRALREHGHCEACHLDYDLDFAHSVELIVRAHPEFRKADLGTYCVGGPAHSPHVVAQVRIGPGERLQLDLALGAGSYRLRGPQLAFTLDFRVEANALASRWDLTLAHDPGPDLARVLRAGGQALTLANDTDRELVVRVERRVGRDDALTAARASSLALFRELFPDELLAPGQLVSLTTITLLVTDLDLDDAHYRALGDARAFTLIHEQFRVLEACVREHGGALVKTVHEGIVAAFPEAADAVRAALDFAPALAGNETTRDLKPRVGIHRGPAAVATLNDHLDYFGFTVRTAMSLPRLGTAGVLILSPAVADDPRVAALREARGLDAPILPAPLSGLPEGFAHRLTRRDPT